MSVGRFAALGALGGLGQGVAQVGASQMQAINAQEEAARRQAEFDRQKEIQNSYFRDRALFKDGIADENRAERAGPADRAMPTARGSRGSSAGGWADVRQLSDQDLADELAMTSGMQREGALQFVRAARGRQTATDMVDDEYGPQQIVENATATDEQMTAGAKAFRMRFNLDKPKDMAESEFMLSTGRKMSNLTPEEAQAKVDATDALTKQREAAAGKAAADARRADRAPAVGAVRSGGRSAAPPDTSKNDRALMASLEREASKLVVRYDPESKARLEEVRAELAAVRARLAQPTSAPAAAGSSPTPKPTFRVLSATPVR